MQQSVKDIVKNLPHKPGVYLMKDSRGTVVYVGKAKDLKNRVSQYFLPGRDVKTRALVSRICDIDFNLCANQYEALLLENNLIKQYMPKYNIDLKDGKSYPMIRITCEDFPKVIKTRRKIRDKSLYFGPFPSSKLVDEYMKYLERNFKIRRCSIPMKKRTEPCLYYHIGQCSAPCCGRISKEEYLQSIKRIVSLLSGGASKEMEKTRKEMLVASKKMEYEVASKKRDELKILELITAPQSADNMGDDERDYVAFENSGPISSIAIMQIRNSNLIGRAVYRAQTLSTPSEAIFSFLVQYYEEKNDLPKELYISHEIDIDLASKFFSSKLANIKIEVPKDGRNYRVLRMAEENAKRDVEKRLRSQDNSLAVELLKDVLQMPNLPLRIEGYDIAQLHGKFTVASLISFYNGLPDKQNYRLFNIQSLNGKIDDFESMREAFYRRYKRIVEENLERPDLIMVDGGKGQVMASRRILDDVGLSDIPLIGLAKERETIVFDNDREDLNLPLDNPALRLLIAIRDECHRFATTSNQRQRSEETTFSLLESINGIGPVRAKRIMKIYENLENISRQTADGLSKDAQIPLLSAKAVLDLFK